MSPIGSSAIGEFIIGESPIGLPAAPPPLSGTDIATIWNVQDAQGDWLVSGAALLGGDDLATAVLISFFSDRLANDDDLIPDGTTNRRGWWGDAGQDYLIGSRLWLLERGKLTNTTAQDAETYALEALQWLIDDGVIVKADVAARVLATVPGKLVMAVILYKTDGTRKALNFVWVWNGIG